MENRPCGELAVWRTGRVENWPIALDKASLEKYIKSNLY